MAICEYEYIRDGHILKIDCMNCIYGASIEDFPICMARTIDKIIEVKRVETIILSQTRDSVYPYDQVQLLVEIEDALVTILKKRKILSVQNLGTVGCDKHIPERLSFLRRIVTNDLRQDPIGAYVELTREIRHVNERAQRAGDHANCYLHYLNNALLLIKEVLDKTKLIQMAKPYLVGYHVGDRTLYREFFHPMVRPNFMFTRFMMTPPVGGREVDRYNVGDTEIQIYKVPNKVQNFYHMIPPEFRLDEEGYTLLDAARRYMGAHRPTRTEFAQPERMRDFFYNVGKDMISELSENMKIELDSKTLDSLAKILTRYTAGFGILEIILADETIQDIYLNSPMGQSPIYVFHEKYEECVTNIIPTRDDAESWATRFRIQSGRPLDEANPVLDTEIQVPGGRARVAAITQNLSPEGLAFSLRRHRDKPWTYPLFIENRMINPMAAGLLSFIIDGARTILFAGGRSSGKTSVLGATLTELMRKYRIVTVEDTLELPVEQLLNLGYNVERLKSRSVITHIESELPADEAIRVSLRLGDSCLIIGEVRSTEAKALYEAMRIGALANVVAGTIHGESPYGVFDRVVNDLGVPSTSFKATDIIVIASRLKSADGLHTYRRVTEITELQKEWSEDPLKEKAFVPLMEYDAKTDSLQPTETLLNGESYTLNEISKRVKDWRDNWEGVWENIKLRAKTKKILVDYANKTGDKSILEAAFTVEANNQFHLISERIKEEYGALDSKRIFAIWDEWIKNEIKSRRK